MHGGTECNFENEFIILFYLFFFFFSFAIDLDVSMWWNLILGDTDIDVYFLFVAELANESRKKDAAI